MLTAVYVLVCLSLLFTVGLSLYRAEVGPTWFDRILALNSIGTKSVLLIAVILFVTDRPDFLDLALLYSLMSFIGTVAVLRFSKYGHFADIEIESGSDGETANELTT